MTLAVIASACSGSSGDPGLSATRGAGAASPEEAVVALVAHLSEADFSAATDLAHPNQAALAALAEGATFAEVAQAIRDGDAAVAANFWAGFAQGTGDFLTSEFRTGDPVVVEQDSVVFHQVPVELEPGEDRVIMVRESDGYRVDLFASFGAGLAERMIPSVERLLSTRTEDALLILEELQATVPSLLAAASRPGLSPDSVQQILRLVELITRLG